MPENFLQDIMLSSIADVFHNSIDETGHHFDELLSNETIDVDELNVFSRNFNAKVIVPIAYEIEKINDLDFQSLSENETFDVLKMKMAEFIFCCLENLDFLHEEIWKSTVLHQTDRAATTALIDGYYRIAEGMVVEFNKMLRLAPQEIHSFLQTFKPYEETFKPHDMERALGFIMQEDPEDYGNLRDSEEYEFSLPNFIPVHQGYDGYPYALAHLQVYKVFAAQIMNQHHLRGIHATRQGYIDRIKTKLADKNKDLEPIAERSESNMAIILRDHYALQLSKQ